MATPTINIDTAANWKRLNPTLTAGEVYYELEPGDDIGKMKLGGGEAWNDTDYEYEGVINARDANGVSVRRNTALAVLMSQNPDVQSRLNVQNNRALAFNVAKYNHVNYGIVRLPDTDYGNFGFECWVKPLGDGYVISEGYGGAHGLLFGFVGSANTGYTLTGNVWNADTATGTSFATVEAVPHGEWCKIGAYGINGDTILLCINDVPSAVVPWDGVRKVAAITDCVLYIGGSDHQNFTGIIGCWRYWENSEPIMSNGLEQIVRNPRPDNLQIASFFNSTEQIEMGIIADYRTGSLEDFGNGLNGSRRNGILAETLSTGTAGQIQTFSFSPLNNLVEGNYPAWVVDPIVPCTIETSAKTPTPSAIVEDTFGGMNVNYWDRGTLGLGVTETGNKTWTGDVANYGKQYGAAFTNNTANGPILLEGIGTNKTCIWEKYNQRLPAGTSFICIFRYIDANNYSQLQIDSYGSGYIIEFVGGVQQPTTDTMSFGLDWTQAKVVLTGTQIQTYKNGVLLKTTTSSVNAAGTTYGWKANSPLLRLTRIAVV